VTERYPSGPAGSDRDGQSDRPAVRLRQAVLETLEDADVPLSLADLALELARGQVDEDEEAWERAECYWIEIYHNHAPALEAAGMVEYDRDRRTVALSEAARDGWIEDASWVRLQA
jgi:hypothetical protein